MPWWVWLTVAWLACDAAFVVAWTLRVRVPEPELVDDLRRGPGERVRVRARVTRPPRSR